MYNYVFQYIKTPPEVSLYKRTRTKIEISPQIYNFCEINKELPI